MNLLYNRFKKRGVLSAVMAFAFVSFYMHTLTYAEIGDLVGTGSTEASITEALKPETTKAVAMVGKPTKDQIAAAKAHREYRDAAWAARTEDDGLYPLGITVPPEPGTETGNPGINGAEPGPMVGPADFRIYQNSIASGAGGSISNIAEPALGSAGKRTFMTWNWYAAYTRDHGSTWTGVNPAVGWPSGKGFCCDQDVLYDRGRNMWVWYRQGVRSGLDGQNVVRISRSLNGGVSWVTWQFGPDFLGLNGRWFDYPHMAMTNDYLYITTNVFNGGSFDRMVLMKIDLNKIRNAAPISIGWWQSTTGWTWCPVQGATDTMYLGDLISAAGGSFRVYWQPEGSNTLFSLTRTIPAWTFTNRNGTCTTSNGTNPCLRADQRITGGWVANNGQTTGEIGFFWNVKEGGGFNFPYVEAATFNEVDKTVKGRPFIFNPSYTWHWAEVAPNERGHVGVVVNEFRSTTTPAVYALLDDDFTTAPPGWPVWRLSQSAGGPSANTWGDYNRIRPFYPAGTSWAASAFTKNSSNVSEARYYIFGRRRDERGVFYWWWR